MKRNVTINKKAYGVKPVTFNAICELEELGLSLATLKDFKKNVFGTYRACFAFHSGLPVEVAGEEMGEHLCNGGTLDDFQPFFEAVLESDFFKRLAKNQATE